MADYAVTVAQRLVEPLRAEQVGALKDLLGEPAAMSVAGDELSLTTDATADDPIAAFALVQQLIASVADGVGARLGAVEECSVLTLERQEAVLAGR